MIGLTSPAKCGADVCHLNLHKTFAIPHGGGGPGVGPIGVAAHLAPFLPGHPIVKTGGTQAIPPITAAPFGSASILTISWAYIKMLGGDGLSHASKVALLNANYLMERLKDHYQVRYVNDKGRCAHEFLIDLKEFEDAAGYALTSEVTEQGLIYYFADSKYRTLLSVYKTMAFTPRKFSDRTAPQKLSTYQCSST